MSQMSSRQRWGLALLMAVGSMIGTMSFSVFALLMMTFGTDGCQRLPQWAGYYFFLPPAVMLLGSIAGPILFGLNKQSYWWAGVILVSGILAILLTIAWFPLLGVIC